MAQNRVLAAGIFKAVMKLLIPPQPEDFVDLPTESLFKRTLFCVVLLGIHISNLSGNMGRKVINNKVLKHISDPIDCNT